MSTAAPGSVVREPGPADAFRRQADDLSTSRLAAGARDNVIGLIVERSLGFALFLALPLLLPPTALGAYYELAALVTLCALVGVLGLDVGVVRFTALAAERSDLTSIRRYTRTAGVVAGVLSGVILVALWAAAPGLARMYEQPDLSGGLRIAALSLPLMAVAYVLVAPSKGLKSMRPMVLATQVVHPGVQLVATLALVLAGLGVAGAAAGLTLAAAGALATALVMHRRLRLSTGASSREPVIGPLVRFSAPVTGMNLMDAALLWLDTLLLGALRSGREVAVYGIVVRLLAIAPAVMFTVVQIFGPFVAQLLARGDTRRLQEVLRTATRWTVLLAGAPLALLLVTGSGVLAVFHQTPSGTAAPVAILSIAFLFDAATGPIGHVLTMSGRSSLNFADNAVAVVVNVGMNLLLIPRLGLLGAAISWAAVIVGLNVVRTLQVWALFRISPFSWSLAKPLAAVVTAAAAAAAVRAWVGAMLGGTVAPVLIAAAAFAAAYVSVLLALGIPRDDRLLIRAFGRRGRADPPGAVR